MWQRSFIAMSVVLGSSARDAAASLEEPDQEAVTALLARLGADQRAARARALAVEVARVAAAVEGMVIA